MSGGPGSNLTVKSAYEGGHRLKRREHNVGVAFCYGMKLKYEDLDDPNYEDKVMAHFKSKSRNSPKKVLSSETIKGEIDNLTNITNLKTMSKKVSLSS